MLALRMTPFLVTNCKMYKDFREITRRAGRGDVDRGGQFMDRFLPMPVQGKLTSETWGADNVKPRDVDNGIDDREWSYWGGNAKLAADGRRATHRRESVAWPWTP